MCHVYLLVILVIESIDVIPGHQANFAHVSVILIKERFINSNQQVTIFFAFIRIPYNLRVFLDFPKITKECICTYSDRSYLKIFLFYFDLCSIVLVHYCPFEYFITSSRPILNQVIILRISSLCGGFGFFEFSRAFCKFDFLELSSKGFVMWKNSSDMFQFFCLKNCGVMPRRAQYFAPRNSKKPKPTQSELFLIIIVLQ